MTVSNPKSDADRGWMVSEEAAGPAVISAREQLENILREEIADWLGVQHAMGGEDRTGIDCSGFVQRIFADALHVSTPRTTVQLDRLGIPVPRRSLSTGDLVFFRPEGKGRHVGIFLDETEFAHVSTSRGVMISSLNKPYWRLYYTNGRRILNSPETVLIAGRLRRDQSPGSHRKMPPK